MADYTYPHVNITTKALQRRTPEVTESTATTLLAPFCCDRGPENKLVAIDTMADFESEFGSLSYSDPDQRQILNIGEWIRGGGRVLACRLTDYSVDKNGYSDSVAQKAKALLPIYFNNTTKKFSLTTISGMTKSYGLYVEAKYTGTYYNDIVVKIEATKSKGYFTITVLKNDVTLETFRNVSLDQLVQIGKNSSYIGSIYFGENKNTGTTATIDNIKITKLYLNSDTNNAYYNFSDKYSYVYLGTSRTEADRVYSTGMSTATNGDVTLDLPDGAVTFYKNPADDQYYFEKLINYREATTADTTVYTKSENNVFTLLGSDDSRIEGTTYYCKDATVENATAVYMGSVLHIEEITTASTDKYVVLSSSLEQITTPIKTLSLDKTTEYISSLQVVLDDGKDVEEGFIAGDPDNDEWDAAGDGSAMYSALCKVLKQPLETPFDTMIDPGYSLPVKNDLIQLFAVDNGDFKCRDDAFLFLTDVSIFKEGKSDATASYLDINYGMTADTFPNIALIQQYTTETDIYSEDDGGEVYVPMTYYYAYLIPYNDSHYGPQWPTAGQSRGVVSHDTEKFINEVPTNKEKQSYYDAQKNYVEKDSTGLYIMTQLTWTTEDTELKFISKSRTLLKIKKDLTKLGRSYLHEFNDNITKANLQNKLNAYLSEWIQNRALSTATCTLMDYTENAALTNEELLIQLSIKFRGTVEVISCEITVE